MAADNDIALVPVEAARLGPCTVVLAPEERTAPDGRQRTDREGRPQWVVMIAVQQVERRGVDVIGVVLTGEEPKGLAVGTRVAVEDLERFSWDMGERSGVTWRAAAVLPLGNGAPPAPAASATGRGKAAGGER
jgi:hypothetical protein